MTRSSVRRAPVRRLLLTVPVAAIAATLTLTACGSGFHAGAAATVGDDRIATSQLQAMVDRGVSAIPATATDKPAAADIERSDLTRLIQLSVLRKLAKEPDIRVTVTDQDIDKALNDAAQSGQSTDAATALKALEDSAAQAGVDAKSLRVYAEVAAYEQKILEALPVSQSTLESTYQKDIGSFTSVRASHILVPTEAQANSILAQLRADPSKFAALAKQYSTDTGSKDNGGDLGYAPASNYVAEFAAAVSAGKVGELLGPVKTQYGYHVIKVVDRKVTSLADATSQLKSQINATVFQQRYAEILKQTKVSVNPRFGTWNPTGGQDGLGVVEVSTEGDLSSPTSNPSTSNPSSTNPSTATPAPSSSPSSTG